MFFYNNHKNQKKHLHFLWRISQFSRFSPPKSLFLTKNILIMKFLHIFHSWIHFSSIYFWWFTFSIWVSNQHWFHKSSVGCHSKDGSHLNSGSQYSTYYLVHNLQLGNISSLVNIFFTFFTYGYISLPFIFGAFCDSSSASKNVLGLPPKMV